MCSALGAFTQQWVAGVFVLGQSRIDLPIALASLLIAALVTTVPRRSPEPRMEPTRYGRAILTSLSVAAASSALALVAVKEIDDGIDPLRASMLIGMLAAAVALRILVNQVRGTHAQRAVQEALEQKEAALADTDKALGRLRRANETLRESEERLRTVFEAAIDGIVELDHQNVILRSNEAFCKMIDLPQSLVEGQPWSALAASIEADDSFAELPATGPTGQGTLHREGHSIYLESRTSQIPGDPPRRLLLVRDVTAARVADQTIRSLFKFLQDRDEDRTRIMRRTNAAIESERNRIARDLHDGPVQGVSAASLSLEAVLLMLKAGEMGEGFEVLAKVRRELSEEADNLRRLMSGLRPPLLEERGLVPALRETLDRYGRDNGVRTEFRAKAAWEIPRDLETLAYRIVQEALSNSAKHADAASVNVAVDTGGGQLRVEIVDDGSGSTRESSRVPAVGAGRARLDARTGRARQRHLHGAFGAGARHHGARVAAPRRRARGARVRGQRRNLSGRRRNDRPQSGPARAFVGPVGGGGVSVGVGDGVGSGEGLGSGSGRVRRRTRLRLGRGARRRGRGRAGTGPGSPGPRCSPRTTASRSPSPGRPRAPPP